MKNKFLMYHHLGLGDHITMSALVRKYAKEHDELHLVVKPWYLENVKFLYRDVHNIKFVVCENDNIAHEVLHHWEGPKFKHHYQSSWGIFGEDGFYTSVGLEAKYRRENFILVRDKKREDKAYNELVKTDKFHFVHDDPDRGYNIRVNTDEEIVYGNNKDYLVFDFLKILEKAQSINVMYSSFFALLETTERPCYLHESYVNKVGGILDVRVKDFAERGVTVV